MNLAALDLGSNSFHLLVARASGSGALTKLSSHKAVLRLGAVVQQHGRLPANVFEQALAAVGDMMAVARAFQVECSLAVGTSALRDASNGADFCRAVWLRHRVAVELISGKEEGELVYRGARSALPSVTRRVAVIDIGGGSVEIAVGDGETSHFVESLPLGFLRLAQAEGGSGVEAVKAVRARALAGSAAVAERLLQLRPDAWVFSGGTARALAKLLLSGASGVPATTIHRVAAEIGRTQPKHLRELGVDESRSEALGIGVAVFSALVERFALTSLHISSGGLREGLLLRELARTRACNQASAKDVQLASAPAWAL
jgi:exopolyphosphatase/guanosine-5'-triphosphate,3'-diphosphate pyrophosphatase